VRLSVVRQVAWAIGYQVLIAPLDGKLSCRAPDFLDTVDRENPATRDLTLWWPADQAPYASALVLGASSKMPIA
jgi:hypothetical protein